MDMNRLLIVDDEKELTSSLRNILTIKFPETEILLANSGPEALAIAKSIKLDMVLQEGEIRRLGSNQTKKFCKNFLIHIFSVCSVKLTEMLLKLRKFPC